MILCRWNGNWYLTAGIIDNPTRCGLRCGPRMPHPSDFKPLPPVGAVVYGSTYEVDAIKFFPMVRYRGHRVDLWNFDPDREEPLLKCHIDQSEISGGGLAATIKIEEELVRDGWTWQGPEGGTKYVHMDQLEKIEGPPPGGSSSVTD